ncbi:MAG TPA: TPM domain-containing protein [Casimicrobiaceae bacterium]|nr:TPM domain-containing protein [Casimicrobiaceae bacterium]
MPWRAPNRFWRHAFTDDADVRRAFPADGMARIERAIREGEATHRGQVCVAVEPALPLSRVIGKHAPRERAIEVFGQMRVWDTEENNGVLVYVLLADRDVEIVADRGIDRKVGRAAWEAICQRMEKLFREDRHADALEAGVREVSALLAEHFPGGGEDANELPDRPVVL